MTQAVQPNIFERITDDLYDEETVAETILDYCVSDIRNAVDSDYLPEDAGLITIRMKRDKKERDTVEIQSNGLGINKEQLKQLMSNIGQTSSSNMGLWLIAPLYITNGSYMFETKNRDSREDLGMMIDYAQGSVVETEEADFFGSRFVIPFNVEEYNFIDFGSKVRDKAEKIDMRVKYELYKNESLEKQLFFNF